MRPEKIQNLLEQATIQSKLSPDLNTKVGAVVVDAQGGTLLSGYNGFIMGAPDKTLPKSGEAKRPYILHAEDNIICRAARKGIALENTILICTLSPCLKCSRLLFQAGIKTVYFGVKYKDFDENLSMKDINITLHQIGNYYKMVMEARK